MALAMTQDAPSLPIVIADYDPRWATMYAEESARIQDVIGEWLVGIEHVGSTSVPGLAAKPVVDMMPGLRSLDDSRHIVRPLQKLGYQYFPEHEDAMPERRYFARPAGDKHRVRRRFHLHIVETTSAFWRRHLAFRDYLRTHPETAAEYGRAHDVRAFKVVADAQPQRQDAHTAYRVVAQHVQRQEGDQAVGEDRMAQCERNTADVLDPLGDVADMDQTQLQLDVRVEAIVTRSFLGM